MDQNQNTPQDLTPKLHGTMHKVYGLSIVILALVVAGIVCVMGNVQIPYLSALYAPAVPPPFIATEGRHLMAAHATSTEPNTDLNTNQNPNKTSAMSSKIPQ